MTNDERNPNDRMTKAPEPALSEEDFLAAIRDAEADITEGRVVSNEEIKAILEKRFADYLADPSKAMDIGTFLKLHAERKQALE